MTQLLYLQDTYLFTASTEYISEITDERGLAVILDQTIFYPQGGGQPSDHGTITSDTGVFAVTDVRLREDGTVLHYGHYEFGSLQPGQSVELGIDGDRRILHARLHSAGHLLDCAVTRAGIPGITPTKGYHFPDGAYVEYDGTLDEPTQYIDPLQSTIADLIAENISTEKEDLSPEEASARGVWAPPGKSARVVAFTGFAGCGCGGTHVRDTAEIGAVTIRKIASKKGKTRIAYEIPE